MHDNGNQAEETHTHNFLLTRSCTSPPRTHGNKRGAEARARHAGLSASLCCCRTAESTQRTLTGRATSAALGAQDTVDPQEPQLFAIGQTCYINSHVPPPFHIEIIASDNAGPSSMRHSKGVTLHLPVATASGCQPQHGQQLLTLVCTHSQTQKPTSRVPSPSSARLRPRRPHCRRRRSGRCP